VSTHPTPNRSHLQMFCKIEGWTLVADATGRPVGHHQTYQLALPDGRILRTRISRPVNRSDLGASLFAHILREQLDVTTDQFWLTVDTGIPPNRGASTPPAETLPLELVNVLIRRVGLTDKQVRSLTRSEAIDRVNEFWSTGK
jgi:hypothetical protein